MADINELFRPTAKTQENKKNNSTNHSNSQTTPARKWKIRGKNVTLTMLASLTLANALIILHSFLKNGYVDPKTSSLFAVTGGPLLLFSIMNDKENNNDLRKR